MARRRQFIHYARIQVLQQPPEGEAGPACMFLPEARQVPEVPTSFPDSRSSRPPRRRPPLCGTPGVWPPHCRIGSPGCKSVGLEACCFQRWDPSPGIPPRHKRRRGRHDKTHGEIEAGCQGPAQVADFIVDIAVHEGVIPPQSLDLSPSVDVLSYCSSRKSG